MRKYILAIRVLFIPILLSGCGTINETFCKTHNSVPDETARENYVLTHPQLKQEFCNAIRSGSASIGMSKEELMASWGNPDSITKNTSRDIDEMWFYWNAWNFHRKVYFKDGVVIKIE